MVEVDGGTIHNLGSTAFLVKTYRCFELADAKIGVPVKWNSWDYTEYDMLLGDITDKNKNK